MSEKDQKLVLFVIIFSILALGLYYGVRPALSSLASIKSEIEDEEEEKSINKLKVAQLPLLEMSGEEIEEKIRKRKSEFFDLMVSDQVDQLLTGMALSHKLYSYDMEILMPDGAKQLSAYQYSALYAQEQYEAAQAALESKKEEEKENKGTTLEDVDKAEADLYSDDSNDTTTVVNTNVYAVEVTMTVGGDDKSMQAFLNELINSDKRIFIKSYSWGEVRSLDKGSNEVVDNGDGTTTTIVKESQVVVTRTLTVDIELYMCDQTSLSEE